ncbi:BLUF domain-containing protein [Nocardioides aurantiacus]|uniref:BLUF domain-containing protein n=1 Tax=Nocardioides aurantiacus TaxID=86796 RepID=UPI00403F9080
MSHLISLTYLSTATVPLEQGDLLALLEHSRVRNRTAGLTGMLLYADGHFIQTLEGPAVAVDAAYGRIERDRRHRDVIVALRDEVTERRFEGWSMGFDGLDADTASRMPGFSAFLDAASYDGRSDEAMGRAGIFHRVFRDRMR